MSSAVEKKARKPNWSDQELEVMADAYSSSAKLIRGKLSPILTSDKKKRAWEDITQKINAVSLKCVRTVEETKKRSQDAQASVKKKEAFRKREASRTGGGPPVEVLFKAWELKILSTIVPEAIHGLEGGIDTGLDVNMKSGSVGDGIVHQGIIVTEVQYPGEMGDANGCSKENISESVINISADPMQEPTADQTTAPQSQERVVKEPQQSNKRRFEQTGLEELLHMKRQKLELEERKVIALEKISQILEKQLQQTQSEPSLSPVIKFPGW